MNKHELKCFSKIVFKDKVVWFFCGLFLWFFIDHLMYSNMNYKYRVAYSELRSVEIVEGKGDSGGGRRGSRGYPVYFHTADREGNKYNFLGMLLDEQERGRFYSALSIKALDVKFFDMCPKYWFFIKSKSYCLMVFEVFDKDDEIYLVNFERTSLMNTPENMHVYLFGVEIKFPWVVMSMITMPFFLFYLWVIFPNGLRRDQ